MNIRILNKSDALLYQELRLSGLKVNPEAFGSTYDREEKFNFETVVERLNPTKDKFVLGAFNKSGSLVGIVTFIRENSLKTSHKGNVFGMYVAPEGRGQGLGKSLMIELIKNAKNCTGLEQINLTVVSANDSAKKLYNSVGFEVYGVERNAQKFNGEYLDEDLMVLYI
ncbi:GNAT family N-acetyltransferase [Geomicrobium sp. JCM 19038]|uniref:GNAT family N-acetyltransferase n=1 Tax=Geomicrobium sp. JCM 19038 TaxID=1460635 RepID=UPI00045F3F20|nr:GNAT family N-acetyltransferase [Geomicrobium sp. JCM 19038]GAK08086.1 acetyltransferase, GNAT family [Geomicrobium sp. JCM 19038]